MIALHDIDASGAGAAMRYVLHHGFECVHGAVMKERLREGEQGEERRGVVAASAQRGGGIGPNFVKRGRIEGGRRA